MNLRILVVDDTSLFRRVISDALAQLPNVEVIATAPNGKIALERAELLHPDMITLDIEMPEMSGLEVLQGLKKRGLTCGVIIVSALTLKGGDLTIRALELGAFDFITKPTGGDMQSNLNAIRDSLKPILAAYHRRWEIRSILHSNPSPGAVLPAAQPTPQAPASPILPASPNRPSGPARADLVLIGISTGGPNALTRILPSLPANFPAPVLIVQHMPALFTQSLAASLANKCAVAVKEAAEGDIARPATIYIAPGGRHMKVTPAINGDITLHITDDPPENNCRPSVDYLFRSVANNFPGRSVAAIMTGMGADGVLGLRLLKRQGCRVIAQDEASCVVFGMPGEAVKAGVVDVILPLDSIIDEINRSIRPGTR